MSLIALKRKTQTIKKSLGINTDVVAPSSYLARKKRVNARSENKTYFITPNVSSSENTQKLKSDTLYGEANCQTGNITPVSSCANRKRDAPIIINRKVCNIHKEMDVDTNTQYIEKKKQGCTRVEQIPRIPGMETNC